ncbi:MAG: 4-(cytidine 5'-diphospho)-2-C-methyl-D-erythritol kinase, partial [Candidatus Woesearchaeota archaeon]
SAGADEVVAAGVDGPNLVSQALEGLRRRGWQAPALRVEIEKWIPVAAGMGGGSTDAAAILRLASTLAPVSAAEVAALAAELGADVPSQLEPGVALGTGAGEVVSRRGALAEHAILVLPSEEERLSTPAVYAEADRLGLPRSGAELGDRLAELEQALASSGRLAAPLLVNDLEAAARSLCPAIGDALAAARATGAEDVMVCGSGPTVIGIFWGQGAARRAEAAGSAMAGEFPGATAAIPVSSPA